MSIRVASPWGSAPPALSSISTRRNRCCLQWRGISASAPCEASWGADGRHVRGRSDGAVYRRDLRSSRTQEADRRWRWRFSSCRRSCWRYRRTVAELIFWRFVQGLLLPPIFTVTVAYVGNEWPPREAATVIGIYTASSAAGGFHRATDPGPARKQLHLARGIFRDRAGQSVFPGDGGLGSCRGRKISSRREA